MAFNTSSQTALNRVLGGVEPADQQQICIWDAAEDSGECFQQLRQALIHGQAARKSNDRRIPWYPELRSDLRWSRRESRNVHAIAASFTEQDHLRAWRNPVRQSLLSKASAVAQHDVGARS